MDKKEERIIEKISATNVAHKVYKKNVAFRIISTILAFFIGISLTTYGILSIMRQNTMFTVKIPEQSPTVCLTLSNTPDFEEQTSRLQYDTKNTYLNNIDGRYELPEDIDEYDGDHSGENYLAFTFYLKNVGKADASVTGNLHATKVVLGADEAIRIKLYEDGEPTVLAKKAKDGNPEPDSVMFYDDSNPYLKVFNLNSGEVKKYTIVIWLEGNDPECINDILGGFVRLEMNFVAEEI